MLFAIGAAGAAAASVSAELPLRLGSEPGTREAIAQLMFGMGLGCIAWSLQRIARQRGTR